MTQARRRRIARRSGSKPSSGSAPTAFVEEQPLGSSGRKGALVVDGAGAGSGCALAGGARSGSVATHKEPVCTKPSSHTQLPSAAALACGGHAPSTPGATPVPLVATQLASTALKPGSHAQPVATAEECGGHAEPVPGWAGTVLGGGSLGVPGLPGLPGLLGSLGVPGSVGVTGSLGAATPFGRQKPGARYL